MKKQDYTANITVNATAQEAFKTINSVTKWWTEDLEGGSKKLNDEFTVRFEDIHFSKQKLVLKSLKRITKRKSASLTWV